MSLCIEMTALNLLIIFVLVIEKMIQGVDL